MKTSRAPSVAPGDWFAVPLPSGGWASGVVARIPNESNAKRLPLLAYFFGPRTDQPVGVLELGSRRAEDAVIIDRIWQFYLGLYRWPILGRQSIWDEEAWPVPQFFSDSRLPDRNGVVVPRFAVHEFVGCDFYNPFRTLPAKASDIVGLRPADIPSSKAIENDLDWYFSQGTVDPPRIKQLKEQALFTVQRPPPRPPGRFRPPTCEAGDWTAIPLEGTTWLPARIARVSRGKIAPKIAVILLYIFPQRMSGVLDPAKLHGLKSSDAALIAVSWDDPIVLSKWPIASSSHDFSSADWPIPVFGIRSARAKADGTISATYFEVHHRDDRLGDVDRYVEVDRLRYESLLPERALTDSEIIERVRELAM